MKIDEKCCVALEYTLKLDSGEIVDQSTEEQPFEFIFGSGSIIPGLEKAIKGKAVGEAIEVKVAPEDGYGERNENMLREIPRDNFPEDVELKEGLSFEAVGPHGPVRFEIDSVSDENIVADFNHPLAGKVLNFDVKVLSVREATDDELEALNAQQHGCGGGSCGSHDHGEEQGHSHGGGGCGGCCG